MDEQTEGEYSFEIDSSDNGYIYYVELYSMEEDGIFSSCQSSYGYEVSIDSNFEAGSTYVYKIRSTAYKSGSCKVGFNKYKDFNLSDVVSLNDGETYTANIEKFNPSSYIFTPDAVTAGVYDFYGKDNSDIYIKLYEMNADGTLGECISNGS
ncbi:MAG: hypothetical protein Q4B47_02595, partial [Eubacteriales bacterium]|nr:hypothetical protein [Eubacteriales bacterium]